MECWSGDDAVALRVARVEKRWRGWSLLTHVCCAVVKFAWCDYRLDFNYVEERASQLTVVMKTANALRMRKRRDRIKVCAVAVRRKGQQAWSALSFKHWKLLRNAIGLSARFHGRHMVLSEQRVLAPELDGRRVPDRRRLRTRRHNRITLRPKTIHSAAPFRPLTRQSFVILGIQLYALEKVRDQIRSGREFYRCRLTHACSHTCDHHSSAGQAWFLSPFMQEACGPGPTSIAAYIHTSSSPPPACPRTHDTPLPSSQHQEYPPLQHQSVF